ncbi:MAG: STAS domain-containing protein [Actinomycetota bacterium]|nr:STAS domain-containing protein [Actinomycetota bacterium]
MDVTVEQRDHLSVLTVSGDVDAGNVDHLRRRIDGLLADGEHRFVVDLSGVPFMDSAGLATLVQLFKRVRIGEGDVRLAALQPDVLRVFQLVRLTRVFDIYDTADAAIASY